ncbi:MAG: class I SAM-dependent methyltransferase [Planctomycetota bacterium]
MARSKNRDKVRKGSGQTLAEKADKFDLYQKSVQSPEHEVEFFEQAFRESFKRKPYTLREDFCGTFSVCCEWVKSNPRRKAMGVDLCGDTLQWGRDNNLARLTTKQQERVRLIEQDVRKRNRPKADVLAAQNFSFWIFKTRDLVVDYFRAARANLNSEGIMVMDMMGGGDCYEEGQVDKRKILKGKRSFKYHWEQASFNPITRDASFYISFRFRDGSKLKRAFEYHWRFWTIPEVREMLAEAGFSNSYVYWELEDEDGEDSGEFVRMDEAESVPCWICYIVAEK